jgi:hypothetical protein
MYNRVGIPFAIGLVIILIFAAVFWLAKAAGWV